MTENKKLLAGILLGAAAGAALALLLTSDKGKEFLSDLKDTASRLGDDVKETIEKGKQFAADLGKKAEEAAS